MKTKLFFLNQLQQIFARYSENQNKFFNFSHPFQLADVDARSKVIQEGAVKEENK